MLRVVDTEDRPATDEYVLYVPGWTWERYLAEAPKHPFCEYERGYLVMHSPVSWEHQDVVGFLYWILEGWCQETGRGTAGMGPAVVRVSKEVGREPDIFVVPREQSDRLHGLPLDVVPSLVIEVVSPGTRLLDLQKKAEEYAALGVPEYWAVDLSQGVLVRHALEEGSYRAQEIASGRLNSAALPGFWIEVNWLWQRPLPNKLSCLKKILGTETP